MRDENEKHKVKTTGELIRQARKARAWTQTDLADRLYTTKQVICSWEKDRTEPNIELLKKLVQLLDISPDELLRK